MSTQCGRDRERVRDIAFTKEYIPPNVMDGTVGYTNTAASHTACTQCYSVTNEVIKIG